MFRGRLRKKQIQGCSRISFMSVTELIVTVILLVSKIATVSQSCIVTVILLVSKIATVSQSCTVSYITGVRDCDSVTELYCQLYYWCQRLRQCHRAVLSQLYYGCRRLRQRPRIKITTVSVVPVELFPLLPRRVSQTLVALDGLQVRVGQVDLIHLLTPLPTRALLDCWK